MVEYTDIAKYSPLGMPWGANQSGIDDGNYPTGTPTGKDAPLTKPTQYSSTRLQFPFNVESDPHQGHYIIFDIKKYCMETLNYSMYLENFNGSIDTLLIPPNALVRRSE